MEESGDVRVSPMSGELKAVMRRAVNYLQEVTGQQANKVHLEGMQYGYRLWRHWMTKVKSPNLLPKRGTYSL